MKVYVEETRSSDVQGKCEKSEGLATSRIAYAEASDAFARKRREQCLWRADYRSVVDDLDENWGDYFIVDVSEGVDSSRARILAENHALKAPTP